MEKTDGVGGLVSENSNGMIQDHPHFHASYAFLPYFYPQYE